jgi:hypothetical protein
VASRRKLTLAGTAVAAAAVVLSLPAVHWRLMSLASGEPTYGGYPPSYWARTAGAYRVMTQGDVPGYVTPAGVYLEYRWVPVTLVIPDPLERVKSFVGLPAAPTYLPEDDEPLAAGGATAVPVLIALLRSPEPQARWWAARRLRKLGPRAAPARGALQTAAADPNLMTAAEAQEAVRVMEAFGVEPDRP